MDIAISKIGEVIDAISDPDGNTRLILKYKGYTIPFIIFHWHTYRLKYATSTRCGVKSIQFEEIFNFAIFDYIAMALDTEDNLNASCLAFLPTVNSSSSTVMTFCVIYKEDIITNLKENFKEEVYESFNNYCKSNNI